MKHFKHSLSAAFSLVEVTLALGICSFCLITLVALLPTGLTASSNASRESTAANIASSIMADLEYVGLVTELDQNGNPVIPEGSTEPNKVFASHTALYGIPCGPANSTATNPNFYTYTTEFIPALSGSRQWAPVASGGEYFVKVNISPAPTDASSGPYNFSVEVSWPASAKGASHRHGAVTLVGRTRTL